MCKMLVVNFIAHHIQYAHDLAALAAALPFFRLPELHCRHCQHRWTPRQDKPPLQCPFCKSLAWNKDNIKDPLSLLDIEDGGR